MMCSICLVELLQQATCTPNSCDHQFCLECLKEWSKQQTNCPLCRKMFTRIKILKDTEGKNYQNFEDEFTEEDHTEEEHTEEEHTEDESYDEYMDIDSDIESNYSDDVVEDSEENMETDSDQSNASQFIITFRTHPYNLRSHLLEHFENLSDNSEDEDI